MGCGSSKADESDLIALCRERVELIRAARDRRYALSTAHAAYFRALAAVGDALHRFVQEELTPASKLPGSPVLVIPSAEGKGKPGSGRGSGSPSTSATPLSHSLSPEGSHLPLSSGSESEGSSKGGRRKGSESVKEAGGGGGGADGEESPRSQPFWPPSPNSSFMKSSTAIPTMVYQEDPFAQPWWNSAYNGYGYEFEYPSYGEPIRSPPQGREDTIHPSIAPGSPPPPPTAEISSWDFFDPFNSYEELFTDYSGVNYGVRSSISSPDLSEVRNREGIPDLEEETDVEPMKEAKKEKKVDDNDSGAKNPMVGSSNTVSTQQIGRNDEKVGGIGFPEKESRSSSSGSKGQSSGGDEGSSGKKKGVTFEDTSYVTEESVPSSDKPLSSRSDGQVLLVQGTRNVMEVVQGIKEHFRSAAGCGEELSRLLEVGKLPFRSRSRIYRVVSSRIFDSKSFPLFIRSRPSFKRSHYSTESTIRRRASSNASYHTTETSSSLSSTLEKLYLWEKKLFKEVKVEEKLRVSYDKKYRLLRALDNRGAESSKIDLTWASVKKLRTKISIIIKSVNAISIRMHKIRDEELKPQLIELIQGFIRMWKFVQDCHQKQLQALVYCKSHSLVMKTTGQKMSAPKATKELELELLNWCNCFSDWITTQKSYIEALNGWQMKWLPQEQEQTPDGLAPFSPTRIGAPSVFIISNDWYHAIKSISAEKVIERMRAFTETVHIIWESQDEERNQQLEEERLLQVYDKRVKSMQASQTSGHLEIASGSDDGLEHHDDSLIALRKRLDEKRAIHKETLERLQNSAASIFPTVVIPTFEQLGNFMSEALYTYNGIRIRDSRGT